MNDRIKKLREASLRAQASISLERAMLLTDYYSNCSGGDLSVPVGRASAFEYILEHKELYIGEGELIVGERGPAPKATPTYPEICTHSRDDFEILNSREKISFKAGEETIRLQVERILPFWKERSIREKIFERIPDQWKESYRAGVFTEFMEQRAPGHTVLDDKIYKKGFKDFIAEIEEEIVKLEPSSAKSKDRLEELKAMKIAAGALIKFAKRYASKLMQLASEEKDRKRKAELELMAAVCDYVPENKPRTFREALQYYWFVHLGVITELNTWDSFNPGRLDQHLYPFYKNDIDVGVMTKDEAIELLHAFWIKFNNQPAPPKVGVTAQESNTYTDFALINLGGLKEDGSDGVNELTFVLLDVIEEMRILQPSSMVQVSKKNPDRFLKRALKIVKTGFGQPSIFNTDAIIQELLRQGKSIEDARNGGASGCVEAGAFGKESYILTGYFNLVKILELTLNNGTDPRTGRKIGIETGVPDSFDTFDSLFEAFKKQLNHFIEIKLEGNRIIEKIYSEHMPSPFLSILIDDCVKKGVDYNSGGARYNTSYVQGVGLGTITDSLSALKYHVYDHKTISMKELTKNLKDNFEGNESLRQRLLYDTPRYGNDDDYADDLAKMVFEAFFDSVDSKPNTKGGVHRINLLPTTSHVYFGSVIGATPDGRSAYQPLSEGISPVQGADINGPTAVIKSASKIDHVRTGGTLLNQKFTPQFLETEEGISKLASLVRTYFKLDGHHIQFNVVTAETLRKAKEHPEEYRDLIVRVAGYSDYFVDLNEALQNEIIRRTEHLEY